MTIIYKPLARINTLRSAARDAFQLTDREFVNSTRPAAVMARAAFVWTAKNGLKRDHSYLSRELQLDRKTIITASRRGAGLRLTDPDFAAVTDELLRLCDAG
jgi:hypothetical protein